MKTSDERIRIYGLLNNSILGLPNLGIRTEDVKRNFPEFEKMSNNMRLRIRKGKKADYSYIQVEDADNNSLHEMDYTMFEGIEEAKLRLFFAFVANQKISVNTPHNDSEAIKAAKYISNTYEWLRKNHREDIELIKNKYGEKFDIMDLSRVIEKYSEKGIDLKDLTEDKFMELTKPKTRKIILNEVLESEDPEKGNVSRGKRQKGNANSPNNKGKGYYANDIKYLESLGPTHQIVGNSENSVYNIFGFFHDTFNPMITKDGTKLYPVIIAGENYGNATHFKYMRMPKDFYEPTGPERLREIAKSSISELGREGFKKISHGSVEYHYGNRPVSVVWATRIGNVLGKEVYTQKDRERLNGEVEKIEKRYERGKEK